MSKYEVTDKDQHINSHICTQMAEGSKFWGGWGGLEKNKREIREGGKLESQKWNKPSPGLGRASRERSDSFQESSSGYFSVLPMPRMKLG